MHSQGCRSIAHTMNCMKVIRSLAELNSCGPCVVTVGNFDGVHRGHQAIFAAVRKRAQSSGLRSAAITFDPHPLSCIAPERAPVPLSTLEQKVALIADAQVDLLLVQPFTPEFSRVSPEEFVKTYLLGAFQARILCVGHNFRFGHKHRGDVDSLRATGAFEVVEVAPVLMGKLAISSSRIRREITHGKLRNARRMLDRCYEIEGPIVPGRGRGRRVAVPTLNMEPENPLLPRDGVYLTRLSTDDGTFDDALTNVGIRPTFSETERTVETHLLDKTPPVDVRRVRIRIIERLRDEHRFPDGQALREQIDLDRARARKFFRRLQRVRHEKELQRAGGEGG